MYVDGTVTAALGDRRPSPASGTHRSFFVRTHFVRTQLEEDHHDHDYNAPPCPRRTDHTAKDPGEVRLAPVEATRNAAVIHIPRSEVAHRPGALKFHQLIPRLRGLVEVQSPHLFELYTYSKALAEGPKLLCPTAEQCEALEHVDVNISFDDYVQPFPTFLLELPEAYRRRLTDRFGFECPQLVVTHHDSRTKYILSFRSACPSGESTFHIMSPRWNTVEEALRFSEDEGNDLAQSEVIQRVALNFGLLMTYYGVRDRGPVDPQSHATHLRNARRKNQGKGERARRLLDAEINVIEFKQDVVVYDRSETQRTDSEGDGSVKRTHWRRGHFRRQVCGHARSARRLIFIKPILVNAHRFQGDVADTEYRLHLATAL